MSDCDRFELFTITALAESLSQAAAQLGISKSAVSKQLKRLETELNVDLFSRSGYRLSLTPQGERLLEQTLRLKRELDDTRTVCQQFHQAPSGPLKVVAFGYFAEHLIFPRLDEFLSRYPKLQLTLDTSERIPNFEREQVDIALGFSLPVANSEEIIQRSMGTTYYVLCASPDYFAKKGIPKTLAELSDHHYIEHTGRNKGHLKLRPGLILALQPYFMVNSVTSMLECAKAGAGLVQLPIYMVKQLLDRGELIAVLADTQRQNEHVYYHYPKYRYVQPKVRKFIEFFLKTPHLPLS